MQIFVICDQICQNIVLQGSKCKLPVFCLLVRTIAGTVAVLQRVLQQRAKTLLKRLEFVPNGYIGFQAYKRTSPRVLNHPRTYCFILKLLLYNLYSICSFKHSFVSQSAQIVVIFLRAQQVSLRELIQIYIYSRREFICAVIFILHHIQGLDS